MNTPSDEAFQAVKELVIFGVALLGAGLGVLNYWRTVTRDRVCLRIIPRSYITSHGENGICIEVINVGYIPVTLSQIGFDLRDRRQIFLHASLLKDLPQRMEPRTAFTAYLTAGEEKREAFARITRAFAQTACDSRFTGTSKSLRGYLKAARAAK